MKLIDLIIILLMFSLVFLVFFQVVNRFILHIPAAWTEEMARYNFVWVSLYGSVKALKEKSHLSVDVIVETMKSERGKMIIDVISSSLVVVFACVLLVTGYMYTVANFGVDCEFGAFPLSIIYSAVPISSFLLLVVSIRHIFDDVVTLRRDW
jgi:TRAP-type C4-dicarboxylate transport system permease small subunit